MDDMLQVGVIANTHGIRGEVKVFPTTDDIKRFGKLKEVYLDTGKEKLLMKIKAVRYQKNMVIVKFDGVDNINDIEKYKSCGLWVTRENAVKLKKDEYFIADMIGMKVTSDEGEELGELIDVIQTGANDVYVVKGKDNAELLIPAIKQCILNVDIEAMTMEVHLLDGLRD
ncbi:MAG: ribosome maturation factor RimM [Eubacterium sp.]|nr:ribosome maturation factor RimM [Eubacterium sp.]